MAKKDEERAKRLAEALRANLRKRKVGAPTVPLAAEEKQPPHEEGLPSFARQPLGMVNGQR
jgi:hypothetical protein